MRRPGIGLPRLTCWIAVSQVASASHEHLGLATGKYCMGSALPVALSQHFVNGARLPSALRFALRRTVLELPPLFPLVILGHIPAPEPPTGLLGADLGPVNQTELHPRAVYDIAFGFLGVFLVRFVSVKEGLASGTCVRFREIRKPVPALLGIPLL